MPDKKTAAAANSGKDDKSKTTGKTGWLKRYAPLVVLVAVLALVIQQGWHKYLTLEYIARNRELLQGFVSDHAVLALGAYMTVYIAVVALSLPGGALLTITGGFLFGWFIGGTATVVAATLGAGLVFLIARTSFGETLAQRAGPWLKKLSAGFREDALNYLLFLRLVPAFPFWLVNLAPALLGVSLPIFLTGTFIGIIPGTFAFSFVGAGLGSIITAQQQAFEQCQAEHGGKAGEMCSFSLDPGALLTPQLLAAFAALGIVALIPVVLKKIKSRKTAKTSK